MIDMHIQLAVLWICVMLTYLLGDVIRIFAGDFKPGYINDTQVSKNIYFGIAIFMVIPIVMIFLSMILPYEINRWANIIVSAIFFLFNIVGLPTYPTLYDRFLLIVSLVFNGIAIWMAWNWVM